MTPKTKDLLAKSEYVIITPNNGEYSIYAQIVQDNESDRLIEINDSTIVIGLSSPLQERQDIKLIHPYTGCTNEDIAEAADRKLQFMVQQLMEAENLEINVVSADHYHLFVSHTYVTSGGVVDRVVAVNFMLRNLTIDSYCCIEERFKNPIRTKRWIGGVEFDHDLQITHLKDLSLPCPTCRKKFSEWYK